MQTKISVVTVTYNSEDFIVKFITSLYEQLSEVVEEVIVVDNASKDNTLLALEELSKAFTNLRTYKQCKNQGYRRGVDFGIEKAKNDIIMLSNADIIIPDKSLLRCLGALEGKNVATCSPRVISYDPLNGPIYAKSTYYLEVVIPFLLTYPSYDEISKPPHQDSVYVDLPIGALLFIKKHDYQLIGGLDQNVSSYGEEEEELSLKFRNSGKKVVFCPSATVYHVGGGSVRTVAKPHDFLVFNTYLARALLYYKYCCDSSMNRMIWWFFFFVRAMRASIIRRSSYPLKVLITLFRRIRLTRFNQKMRMTCKWKPLLLFSAATWYLCSLNRPKYSTSNLGL